MYIDVAVYCIHIYSKPM